MTTEDAERIHGPVALLTTGRYRYDVPADRWTLDPAAREILALGADAPLDVSTLLDLLPKEERAQVARFVLEAIEARTPFSSRHHLNRPGGTSEVLVVGEATYDGDRVVAVHGHVVHLGPRGREGVDDRIDQAIAEVVANRATIEQAKGALSLAYGFGGEDAIALLRWWSSHRNVKVNVLAGRLVTAIGSGAVSRPRLRADVDALLASVTDLEEQTEGVAD